MNVKFLAAHLLSNTFKRCFHVNHLRRFRHIDDDVSNALSKAGYRGECHKVKTEDGYILKLHRVLPKKHSVHKGSAFLMHGMYRCSTDYLASGPKIALAYYLADHGYDVWLGNARGTKHGNEHETLAVDSKEFWKFSFHEIGLYDVQAMLNFMLEETKSSKTFYVGHSQGTCSLLALLSTMPEYNDKIIEAHLMTPAVFLRNPKDLLLPLLAKRPELFTVSLKEINQKSKNFTNFSLKLIQKFASNWDKFDISLIVNLSSKLCNINGYSPDTAMALYKNFTCVSFGTNKKETQISEVN